MDVEAFSEGSTFDDARPAGRGAVAVAIPAELPARGGTTIDESAATTSTTRARYGKAAARVVAVVAIAVGVVLVVGRMVHGLTAHAVDGLTLVAVLFVVARQARTLRENRQLRRHLEAKVAERTVALSQQAGLLHLLQQVTSGANRASTVNEALGVAVAELGAATGWPVAHAWSSAGDGSGDLVSAGIWHVPDADRFEAYRTWAASVRLAPGRGLAGWAAGAGRPVWTPDMTRSSGLLVDAGEAGLRAGVAFAVVVGDETVAVIELAHDEVCEPDEGLLALLPHVAEQLARVVERTRVEDALRASEERTRLVVETASDAFIGMDADGRIVQWNHQSEATFGWTHEEAVGRLLSDTIVPAALREAHDRGLRMFLATGEGRVLGKRLELHAQHRDGHQFPVEVTVWPLRVGASWTFNAFVHDISERKEFEEQLAHQALHDPLTGLPNRTLFHDRLSHALARAGRRPVPVAVLFLDLDGFKTVNDSLGHGAGDELLVAVGRRLTEALRADDTVARLGGDEFAILIEGALQQAQTAAERVLELLRAPFYVQGKEVFARASIGIASSQDGRAHADELLRNADVAMYRAKSAGKGRYEVFEARMHAAAVARLELEVDLRRALEREQFVVHYQPTVVLADESVAGVEALVRWRHPRRGMVPPLEFIPAAEETGLIVPIGRWVLEQACQQVAQWQRRFPDMARASVAVNLSARQLQEPGLVSDVASVLADSGLDPESLMLEITESVLMEDTERTTHRLRELKGLGIRLGIDDFGTGYSSLSYLRRFPVDVLKIDRFFVNGIPSGTEEMALVRAIVKLGHSFRLETVAEGIERPEQLVELRAMGCHLGQGFLFAEPMAPAVLEHWLADPARRRTGRLAG